MLIFLPVASLWIVKCRYMRLAEYFEEMFSLLMTLTSEFISERMWQVFPTLIEVFNSDTSDYFTGMCMSVTACLNHNHYQLACKPVMKLLYSPELYMQ